MESLSLAWKACTFPKRLKEIGSRCPNIISMLRFSPEESESALWTPREETAGVVTQGAPSSLIGRAEDVS